MAALGALSTRCAAPRRSPRIGGRACLPEHEVVVPGAGCRSGGPHDLAEKAAQQRVGDPRLGVQEYTYWSEAQHGVSAFWGGNYFGGAESTIPAPTPATSFPTSFAASMSWYPALVRRETSAASDEARGFLDPALFGKGNNNLGPSRSDYGSLFYFNPTINLARGADDASPVGGLRRVRAADAVRSGSLPAGAPPRPCAVDARPRGV